jgi:hypothetical protein
MGGRDIQRRTTTAMRFHMYSLALKRIDTKSMQVDVCCFRGNLTVMQSLEMFPIKSATKCFGGLQ